MCKKKFSLFTEITASFRYALNGTEFRYADDSLQFHVPISDSDGVSMQAFGAQLSISIDVNDTTCFLSISLRYWCENNSQNKEIEEKTRGCLEDNIFLYTKWIINCDSGGFEYKFISDTTIKHVLRFKTISKYFIVVVSKYIFIMIGMFV